MVYYTSPIFKNCNGKLQKKLTPFVVGMYKNVTKRTTLNFECGFFYHVLL